MDKGGLLNIIPSVVDNKSKVLGRAMLLLIGDAVWLGENILVWLQASCIECYNLATFFSNLPVANCQSPTSSVYRTE